MRILQLVTKRQLRGAEVFASVLSEELQKHNVSVFYLGLRRSVDAEQLEPKVDHVADLTDGLFVVKILHLSRLVRHYQPDIIQANGSITLKYAVCASLFTGLRARIVYRNISMISDWMGNPLKRALYRSLFRKVDRVASVSEASRLDFIKTLNFPAHKIKTLRRGVAVPDALGDKLNDSVEPLLIHVGSFTPEKNHLGLLDIFQELIKDSPSMKLICLGDGPLKETVASKVMSVGLGNSVSLFGVQKNIQGYFRKAWILLMTSSTEGIPGVILEAAAHGTPAVAYNVGGISEAIVDGVTGYLVKEGDKEEFVRKVQLLCDPVRRTKMGQSAFEYVRDNFNRDRVASKFLNLYTELL